MNPLIVDRMGDDRFRWALDWYRMMEAWPKHHLFCRWF